MGKRKLIAIIAADLTETYQKNVVSAIIDSARAHGYTTAVFASFIKESMIDEHSIVGETYIYDLMNLERFDGVILLSTTILMLRIRNELYPRLLRECKCPVVCIDDIIDGFYSVIPDNAAPIRTIVNHFIEHHGFTRINCITGPKGTTVAEDRLAGYKEALAEHGIPLEEERYGYGDFWKRDVIPFADKFLSSELPMPQAVICGNDTMALSLCEYLATKGIRVPEDISVSGFDRLSDGIVRKPQLTSVEIASSQTAEKAITIIDDFHAGKNPERIQKVVCDVYFSESCGCGNKEKEDELREEAETSAIVRLNDMTRYLYSSRYMSEDMLQVNTLDECVDKIMNYRFLIPYLDNFYLCLCDNWDILPEDQNEKRRYAFSNDIIVQIAMRNNEYLPAPYNIKLSDMLPSLYEDSDTPEVFFFNPLSFKGMCFGYLSSVFTDNSNEAFDYRFRLWIHNINNSLEHLRVQLHLQWALQRLDNISIIDTLTGIYNRRGYERYVHAMFDKAVEEKKPFLIILGDMDCLKTINDNYGHNEGDVALKVIAKAFQSCFTGNEICARIGGDEMIIIGCDDYNGNTVDNYELCIENYLERYNANSNKPYSVCTSLGSCCIIPDKDSSLDDFFILADTLMYTNKKFRKKRYGDMAKKKPENKN